MMLQENPLQICGQRHFIKIEPCSDQAVLKFCTFRKAKGDSEDAEDEAEEAEEDKAGNEASETAQQVHKAIRLLL